MKDELESPRRRPTLADVAERADVSISTASFVLNDRADMRISPGTRDRVRQAARVLGYTRRRRAPEPATTLPLIGFVSDTIATDHYAGGLLGGAMAAAGRAGHFAVVVETGPDRRGEESAIRALIDRGVRSFVYSAMATKRLRVPAILAGHRTVLLNCLDPAARLPSVVPDEAGAGRLAAERLLAGGHSAIWTVGANVQGAYAATIRHRAIAETLRAARVAPARQIPCPWWPPDARLQFGAALLGTPRKFWPTGVIALNDRAAMGVYQAAREAGLSIPGDLSVVSFDDSELAEWLHPGLTSLTLPHADLGARAVELLLGDNLGSGVEVLPMPLHERESVAD